MEFTRTYTEKFRPSITIVRLYAHWRDVEFQHTYAEKLRSSITIVGIYAPFCEILSFCIHTQKSFPEASIYNDDHAHMFQKWSFCDRMQTLRILMKNNLKTALKRSVASYRGALRRPPLRASLHPGFRCNP